MENIQIINDDCMDYLNILPANSIDCIITDYRLGRV